MSRRGTARKVKRGVAAAAVVALAACALAALAASPAPAVKAPKAPATTPVVFVGNNWDGTADVLRFTPPSKSKPASFKRIARLNIIPDIDQRMQEILTNPQRLGYFLAIRQLIGEGHDQFVDDMYSTNDGTLLIVSRPSFADVVAIDLATGQIAWRFKVDGQRSDHMAHLARRQARRGLGLDRQRRPHPRHGHRPGGVAGSRRATRRTRTTTRATAAGSTTPASASSTRPPTSRSSTRPRAIAASRSSTRTPTRSSRRSTWARSSPRPATRT